MNDAIKMQISAFVDGELPDNECELLLRRLSHDAELRQQAAEYYAIGRAMRGQRIVPGLGQLRGRIAAALDDSSIESDEQAAADSGRSYWRPVGGLAIAATVALVAILGLQQIGGDAVTAPPANGTLADGNVPAESYTVPSVYHELHRERGNNINARLATLRMLEEGIEELEPESQEPDVADDTAEAPAAGTP